MFPFWKLQEISEIDSLAEISDYLTQSVLVLTVNIGQAAFESLTQIVLRLHQMLENSQDEHGRNQLLASYITYVFAAPYNHSPTASPEHFTG